MALQGDLFFRDQEGVDEYVGRANNAKCLPKVEVSGSVVYVYIVLMILKDCHEFLAGNAMRSSTRFRALDETALYGVSCRHEFPTLFCNLIHGERYVSTYYAQSCML